MLILAADLGAKALWLLYLWLASAIAASELSKRKGYGEKVGPRHRADPLRRRRDHLALRARAQEHSRWKQRKAHKEAVQAASDAAEER